MKKIIIITLSISSLYGMDDTSIQSLKEKFLKFQPSQSQYKNEDILRAATLHQKTLELATEEKHNITQRARSRWKESSSRFDYKCNLCKCAFQHKRDFQCHLNTKKHKKISIKNGNSEDIYFPCCPEPNCNFIITKRSERRHASWHKPTKTTILCDVCQLAFSSESNVKKHFETRLHESNKATNQNINTNK